MKGFFPVILSAVKDFTGADFKQPLIVIATADEERAQCREPERWLRLGDQKQGVP